MAEYTGVIDYKPLRRRFRDYLLPERRQKLEKIAVFLKRAGAILVIGAVMVSGVAASGVIIKSEFQGGGGAPAFDGTCLVSNRTEWDLGGDLCDVNTTINHTSNTTWVCNQPLSNYGPLPIRVNLIWSIADPAPLNYGFSLNNGCEGDGNSNTMDLFITSNLTGVEGNIGWADDAGKLQPNGWPRNIDVSAELNCGPRAPGAHQDGWQFQGGINVQIVNSYSGLSFSDPTCQGAGGATFYSANTQQNVDILGGEFVVCNQNIFGNSQPGQGNDVIDAKFRAGPSEPVASGGDPDCINIENGQPYNQGNPCSQMGGIDIWQNNTCEHWIASTNTWQSIAPTS